MSQKLYQFASQQRLIDIICFEQIVLYFQLENIRLL